MEQYPTAGCRSGETGNKFRSIFSLVRRKSVPVNQFREFGTPYQKDMIPLGFLAGVGPDGYARTDSCLPNTDSAQHNQAEWVQISSEC